MRILLYGMQSSGASTIAVLLAQNSNCVAFVDIWNMFAAPDITTDHDVIAKVVVTTAYPLDVHKARFKPDLTVLVLRHPVDNYLSLVHKSYAHESGLMHEKFAVLEGVLTAPPTFDAVVYYEDFVFNPNSIVDVFTAAGWPLGSDALALSRTESDIVNFNAAALPGFGRYLGYGIGNFQPNTSPRDLVRFSTDAEAVSHLSQLCPTLIERYREIRIERGEAWNPPEGMAQPEEMS